MIKLLIGFALLLTSACQLSRDAAASDSQPAIVCTTHEHAVAFLERHHDEKPVALAVTSSGWLLEVFAAEGGETWTLVFVQPNGKTCWAGQGEGWRALSPVWGPEAPS